MNRLKILSHKERRERRREMVDLIRSGVPLTEVANRYGISVNYMRKLGRLEVMSHAERKERRDDILHRVRDGEDPSDVADRHGMSVRYVRNICRDHGIAKAPRIRTPRSLEILARLQNEATSANQIAKEFEVSHQYVSQLIRQAKAAGMKFEHRR